MKKLLLVALLILAGCRPNTPPASPPAAAPHASLTVRSGHPRVWLTADRLNWLRSSQNRLEFKRLVANCDDDLNRAAHGLPLTYTSPLNHALLYRVTGQTKYAAIAAKLCEAYIAKGTYGAMATVGAVSPHGFGARIVIPEVSVSYDWLADYLSPADKSRWAKQIMDWCDWCWLETNPSKGCPPLKYPDTWSQFNAGDNFFLGYLQSLIGALACYGDEPRAQTHIDLGMTKLAGVNDYLNKYGKGGYSLEGTNYGSWLRHAYLWAALVTATDQTTPMPAWFLADATACRWQITAPNRKQLAPLGGQPVERTAPILEDHTGIALVALSHGDAATQAVAKSWLDSITYTRKKQNSWMPALWYRNEVKAADVNKLPLSYRAEGSGYVSMRSGWDTNATWVIYQCGPVKESHQSYAAGEFYVWAKGDWLTGPARLWGLGGELLPSEFNNVIMVGDKGQPGQVSSQALPKDSMKILSFSPTVVEGEAGKAYDYYRSAKVWPVLEGWKRQVTFAAPNKIVVVDTVRKVNEADPILWQLHCKSEPWIAGREYGILGTGVTLRGRASLSVGGLNLSVGKIYKGKGGTLSSHRVEVVCTGGAKEIVLTNTLEIVTP